MKDHIPYTSTLTVVSFSDFSFSLFFLPNDIHNWFALQSILFALLNRSYFKDLNVLLQGTRTLTSSPSLAVPTHGQISAFWF